MREVLEFKSEEEFSNWAKRHADYWIGDAVKAAEAAVKAAEAAEDSITHEKAKYLGYEPVYGVYACFLAGDKKKQCGAVLQYYQVDYKGKRPTPEDLIKICLAPKNPSIGDLDIVERCRKELEKKSDSVRTK